MGCYYFIENAITSFTSHNQCYATSLRSSVSYVIAQFLALTTTFVGVINKCESVTSAIWCTCKDLFMCVYVCMCVCMYVCVCVCTNVYMYKCTYLCICFYKEICLTLCSQNLLLYDYTFHRSILTTHFTCMYSLE